LGFTININDTGQAPPKKKGFSINVGSGGRPNAPYQLRASDTAVPAESPLIPTTDASGPYELMTRANEIRSPNRPIERTVFSIEERKRMEREKAVQQVLDFVNTKPGHSLHEFLGIALDDAKQDIQNIPHYAGPYVDEADKTKAHKEYEKLSPLMQFLNQAYFTSARATTLPVMFPYDVTKPILRESEDVQPGEGLTDQAKGMLKMAVNLGPQLQQLGTSAVGLEPSKEVAEQVPGYVEAANELYEAPEMPAFTIAMGAHGGRSINAKRSGKPTRAQIMTEATAKPDLSQKTPVSDNVAKPAGVADQLGIQYDGWRSDIGYQFTDPKSQSTFCVNDLTGVNRRLIEIRKDATSHKQRQQASGVPEAEHSTQVADDLMGKRVKSGSVSGIVTGYQKGRLVIEMDSGNKMSVPHGKNIEVLTESKPSASGRNAPMTLNERGKSELTNIKGYFEDGGLNIANPIFREEVVSGHYMRGNEAIAHKYSSSTHEAFRNKYSNTNEVATVLDKAINGEPLTSHQRDIVRQVYTDWREWRKDAGHSDYATAELNLKAGDELRIGGDWHRVIKTEDGTITIKDGRTLKIDDTFDRLSIDETRHGKPYIRRNVPVEQTNVKRSDIPEGDTFGASISRKARPDELVDTETAPAKPKVSGKDAAMHEMTRGEFIQWSAEKTNLAPNKRAHTGGLTHEELWIKAHKKVIEHALKDGKPVPESVLKDYPYLAKQGKGETTPSPRKSAISEVEKNTSKPKGKPRSRLDKMADNFLKMDEDTPAKSGKKSFKINTKKPSNKKLAASLRQKAENLDNQIDAKLNPAIASQNPTARRARIAGSMYEEGLFLQKIQEKLHALADLVEKGDVPEILSRIKTKADVESILGYDKIPTSQWTQPVRKRLAKMDITADWQIKEARKALDEIGKQKKTTKADLEAAEIKKIEQDLSLRKEPGFFVTPDDVVQRMVDRADIQKGDAILEPSAGLGNIADKLPKDQIEVIEYNSARQNLLKRKGYDIAGTDFLEHKGQYDKIVMNPPFEKGQDITHVRHAYNQLKPGGKIVAIMGEGAFFRGDKKATSFRSWFDDLGGVSEKLPQGSFKKSGTGVAARIVELEKPAGSIESHIEYRHAGITPEVFKKSFGFVVPYLKKAVPTFLRQYKNRLPSIEGQKLVGQIEHADNRWHRRWGGWMEDTRQAGVIKSKMTEQQAYDLSNALEGKLAKDVNPEQVKAIRKILNMVYYSAKALGVKLPGYRKMYFPRMMKKQIADAVFDNLKSIEKKYKDIEKLGYAKDNAKLSELVDRAMQADGFKPMTKQAMLHLVKTGQAKNLGEAFWKLRQQAIADIFRPFGNLEKSRTLDLPSQFYERDARQVIPRYLDAAAKRMAEVEVWGPKGEKAVKLIADIQARDPMQAKLATQLLEMWTGKYDREHGLIGGARTLADIGVSAEFATKIGLGTATVPNLTQFLISIYPIVGGIRFMKGGIKLTDAAYRGKSIRASGATIPTAVRAFAGYEPHGFWGKVSDVLSKTSGFYGINKLNQYLGAATADVFITDLMNIAKTSGYQRRRAWAKSWLEKFHIDPSAKLTTQQRLEAMYRFATDSQLQKNVLNDPVLFNNPKARPWCLFKRFGYRQAAWIKDNVIMHELVGNKNPLPILRLVAGGAIGGEFVIWAKNLIRQTLSGEPVYRKEDAIWERVINDLVAVGSLGIISDLVSTDGGLINKIEFLASPVFVSDFYRVMDILAKTEKDIQKYDDWSIIAKRTPSRIAPMLGSLPNYLSKRIMTPQQKRSRTSFFKGREKVEIIDLFIAGKHDKAGYRIALWNQYYPWSPMEIKETDIIKRMLSKNKG